MLFKSKRIIFLAFLTLSDFSGLKGALENIILWKFMNFAYLYTEGIGFMKIVDTRHGGVTF